jgi:colicin import membrane protein
MSDSNVPEIVVPSGEQITAWLEYEFAGLIGRRDELLKALQTTDAAHASIADDEALGTIAENRRMAETLVRTAETRRKEAKQPFADGSATVDTWFKRLAAPLDAPLRSLRSKMDNYSRRRLEAERARRAAEAAEKAAEARRQAAIAAAALAEGPGREATARLAEAAGAAQEAERAERKVDAKAADHTRAYGPMAAVSSMRTRWVARIEDEAAVPREFLSVDMTKVNAALRAAPKAPDGRPMIDIPGCAIEAEMSTQVR